MAAAVIAESQTQRGDGHITEERDKSELNPVIAAHTAACGTPAIAYAIPVANPSNSPTTSMLLTDTHTARVANSSRERTTLRRTVCSNDSGVLLAL